MHQTYSANEVHALLFAAYQRGRYDADINDLHGTWAEHDEPQATREQRVAARLDEMDRVARAQAAREGRPYRLYPGGGLGVDWETGRPIRNQQLRSAA